MTHGIGHDPSKGGVPTSAASLAKENADDYSVNKLYWGVGHDGCPKIDDAPARLDNIQNLIIGLAQKSGVQYDSGDCATLANMICALIENNAPLPAPQEILDIICGDADAFDALVDKINTVTITAGGALGTAGEGLSTQDYLDLSLIHI